MIKVEYFKDGAKATILREGERTPLFIGQLLHGHDLETLQVEGGIFGYSVDELDIVEVNGKTGESVVVYGPNAVNSAADTATEEVVAETEVATPTVDAETVDAASDTVDNG